MQQFCKFHWFFTAKLRRLTEHRSRRTTRKLQHEHAIRSFRSRVKHKYCKAHFAKHKQTKRSTARKLQRQQASRSFRSRVKHYSCKAQFAKHKQTLALALAKPNSTSPSSKISSESLSPLTVLLKNRGRRCPPQGSQSAAPLPTLRQGDVACWMNNRLCRF